jgi:integral membrane protein
MAAFQRVKWLSLIEGLSLIALLFIAMPIKYIGGNPHPVEVVGMAHGLLWIVLLLVLAEAWLGQKWPFRWVLLGGIASVIPFAAFAYERWLARETGNR